MNSRQYSTLNKTSLYAQGFKLEVLTKERKKSGFWGCLLQGILCVETASGQNQTRNVTWRLFNISTFLSFPPLKINYFNTRMLGMQYRPALYPNFSAFVL